MSLTPRITMIGLYNYDNDLFHLLSLPDGMDKDLFVNVLLMRYGENPVIFPTVPFFKSAVGVWSAKWYDSIERMLEAVTEDYNPLHNYDRHESYTDTETGSNTGSSTGTIADQGAEESQYVTDTDTTGTEENTISAENESTYQPDNKREDSGTLDSTVTGRVSKGNTRTENRTDNGSNSRTLNHTAHLYGNIGVTTSQQMLSEEIKLRKDLSIYDVAAELFYREFCLYVY